MAWIFVLVVVVFIHELGHFLVARWCNVAVSAFSIGFGREIFGFTDSKGTRWKIGWIPLGGYVKFMDDENGASMPSHDKIATMTEAERAGSFHAKPLWQRAAVVAAGPLANFLSAILMFAAVAYFTGIQTIPTVIEVKPLNPANKAGLKSGDVIKKIDGTPVVSFQAFAKAIQDAPGRELTLDITRDGVPAVLKLTPYAQPAGQDKDGKPKFTGWIGADSAESPRSVSLLNPLLRLSGLMPPEPPSLVRLIVQPDHVAVQAGLKTGDQIKSIDGAPVTTFGQLSMIIAKSAGRPLMFEVLRDGTAQKISVTPQAQTVPDGFGGNETRGIVGISPGSDFSKLPVVYPSVGAALWSGVDQVGQVISSTLGYFYDVFRGYQSVDKIGGIATVIDVSNKVATFGFAPLINIIGLLSVSIGLLNLFPIPLLDGGHLMFYALEAIRGRPLSEQAQEMGFRIGFAVVSFLMVLALWNDRFRIMRWFS